VSKLPRQFQDELKRSARLKEVWSDSLTDQQLDDNLRYERDLRLLSLIKEARISLSRQDLTTIFKSYPHSLLSNLESQGVIILEDWCGLEQDYIDRLVSEVSYRPLTFSTAVDLDRAVKSTTFTAQPWMARGVITLLISSPGLGKTYLALDIARRLLNPRLGWFDDTQLELPSNSRIVWCDTEASQGILRDRIEILRIPKSRVVFPFEDPLREIQLDNAADMAQLERVVGYVVPSILVIDSLRGSNTGEENDSRMQGILKNVSRMVLKHDINCLTTHHTNRPPPGQPDVIQDVNRTRGSTAIAAQCRTIWALDRPNKQSEVLRLSVIKNNLAPKPEAIGLRVGEKGVEWTDEVPEVPRRRTKKDEAAEFLTEFLKDGPKPAKEVEELAKEEGISLMTLRRARKKMGLEKIPPNKEHDHHMLALPHVSLRPSDFIKSE